MSIELKKISYKIKNKTILKDVNLELKIGKISSLIGPNGAGKSTLVNLISGDMKPTKGEIYYNNTNIEKVSLVKRAEIRSVLSQSQSVIFNYYVREIIEMGWIEEIKIKSGLFEKCLKKVINECNLTKLINRKYNTLSGGEQKRVQLARTMIQLYENYEKNKFIILDEPTSSMDPKHVVNLIRLMKTKIKIGYSVFMVIHDINLAYQISDEIILLKNGEIFDQGLTKKIITKENIKKVFDMSISLNNKYVNFKYE